MFRARWLGALSLLGLLALLCMAAPASAAGPALSLPGQASAPDPYRLVLPDIYGTAQAQGTEASPGFFTDLGRLYTCPWEIGARESAIWLASVFTLLRLDQQLFDYVHANLSSPAIESQMGWITQMGAGAFPLLVTGLVWLDDPEAGLDCLEAMAFAGINVQFLKNLLGMARPRAGQGPVFIGPTLAEEYHAMPSGHTANAFALATVLAAAYPEYKWVFYSLAALVGISRIYLEAHWPSNVLAGALIGVYAGQRVLGHEFTIFKWEW